MEMLLWWTEGKRRFGIRLWFGVCLVGGQGGLGVCLGFSSFFFFLPPSLFLYLVFKNAESE